MLKSRVFFVINNLGFGGAERLVVDDINELLRMDQYEVYLITLKPEPLNSIADQCILPLDHRIYLDFRGFFSFNQWSKLINIFKKRKPDFVFTHLWFSNTVVRAVSLFMPIGRIISFEHNVYDSVKTKKQFWIDRLLQKRSNKIIAVSSAVKKSLIKHGIDPGRVEVVINGIPTSRYKPTPGVFLKTALGLEKNDFVYLFIGRLIEQKAPDVLLKAFVKVSSGKLLVAGDGKLKDDLISLSEELGIRNRVKFLGIVRNIPELLGIADCFVLPSRHEGLGIVVLEAMAAGKPIVVSNFEAANDIVENKKNALVVPIDDVDALSEALNLIKNNEELRLSLSRAAQQESQNYSIERHVKNIFV